MSSKNGDGCSAKGVEVITAKKKEVRWREKVSHKPSEPLTPSIELLGVGSRMVCRNNDLPNPWDGYY